MIKRETLVWDEAARGAYRQEMTETGLDYDTQASLLEFFDEVAHVMRKEGGNADVYLPSHFVDAVTQVIMFKNVRGFLSALICMNQMPVAARFMFSEGFAEEVANLTEQIEADLRGHAVRA